MSLQLNPITTPDQIGGFNTNFQLIEDYVNNNLLNRQGTSVGEPNQMEVSLDMNGHYILNVETDLGVANSIISVGTADSRYIQKSGAAMSGNLNMSGNFLTNVGTPVSEDQGTNKAYVDAADLAERIFTENGLDGKLDKTGGTVTGFISMAGNKIYNLADPTDPNEGANKRYVDSILPDEIQLNILKGRVDDLRTEYDAHIVDYDAHIVTYDNHVLDFDQLHSEFDAHIVAYNNFEAATNAHIASTTNPHSVTKAQVGLGSVDNVSAASLRDRATHTGTQTLATISDSGTAAGKNTTSSRTSTSTALVLEAAGMNAHRTSGDHDGRYYQKSEFSNASVANTIGGAFTTMPEVSGDPVVESGANGNGNWVRFADGTQICTRDMNAEYANSATLIADWTFPVSFTSSPTMTATLLNAGFSIAPTTAELGVMFIQSVTTTGGQAHQKRIQGMTNFVAGNTFPVSLYAIGRWK